MPHADACQQFILFRHSVKLQVTFAQKSVTKFVVHVCIKAITYIGSQAFGIPVREVKEDGTLNAVFDIAAIHELLEEDARNPCTESAPEVVMVAIKINEDFIADNTGNATDVAVFHFIIFEADVGLFHIAEAVKNHHLQSAGDFIIEHTLDIAHVFIGRFANEAGQLIAAKVEVHIYVFETVIIPEEVVVLDTVFAE